MTVASLSDVVFSSLLILDNWAVGHKTHGLLVAQSIVFSFSESLFFASRTQKFYSVAMVTNDGP